jgi:hypothetical protein
VERFVECEGIVDDGIGVVVSVRVLPDSVLLNYGGSNTPVAPVNPTCTFLLEVVTPGLTPSK